MAKIISWPSAKQSVIGIVALCLWMIVTALFVGLRAEHIFLGILILLLFFVNKYSRKLLVALLPFVIFGISYDWMNIVPNYHVNQVNIQGLHDAEKALFGITLNDGTTVTPNEYFLTQKHPIADFLAGIFYLCWVPLPIFFGLWLYFTGKTKPYLHFAIVFLLVNLIGFAGYYLHPAAPPWYHQMYGAEFIEGTGGEVAGLEAFGRMTGWTVFEGLYSRNANVFAAVPSLHSAYTLVAFIYAVRAHSSLLWKFILGLVTVGIWATAVYTSHHYIIDVLSGVGCALLGFIIFEYVFMRFGFFRNFITNYANFVTLKNSAVNK